MPPESQESKNRRLLFDRVRHTLSDLMMTADEKNHVISNANDELNRQITRLDTVFPFIAGEVSDESRLGSLTHWAYSNHNTAKAATNERPRREAAAAKELALHEAEALSRSEARREAVLARKHRRGHGDSEFNDNRASGARKGHGTKARSGAVATGDHAAADHPGGPSGAAGTTATTKRRKVERSAPVEPGAAMERTVSGTGSAAGRGVSKDASAPDATKKRSRAPNSGAARKRYVLILHQSLVAVRLTRNSQVGTIPVTPLSNLPYWRHLPSLGHSMLHERQPALDRLRQAGRSLLEHRRMLHNRTMDGLDPPLLHQIL